MREVLLLAVALSSFQLLYSQKRDSLQIKIGSNLTYASGQHQPFWIKTNQFGTIADRQADVSTHVAIHEVISFGKKDPQDSNRVARWRVSYGAELYNNQQFRELFFKEAYLKAGSKNWEFRGGRFADWAGEMDPTVSSGSLGMSNNSLPIPKIGLALRNYISVPFTNNWIQVKGSFYHGWLGSLETTTGAYLHQKNFSIKLGKHQLQGYGSLHHFAQWGGRHPRGGLMPNRLKDYARVVMGAQGDASDPVYRNLEIDVINATGNHLLIPEFGLRFNTKGATFRLYTQTIFEKGFAKTDTTRDELAGLKMFGKDRLVGLEWQGAESSLIQKVLLETIYTMHQGGQVRELASDQYYNNHFYRGGWVYKDQIIGTPLFITQKEARTRYANTVDTSKLHFYNVVSNRIKGLHIALKGQLAQRWSYRTFATLVEHHGTYDNQAFGGGKSQLFFLFENAFRLSKHWSATGAVGIDAGKLSNNIGGSIKVEWSLK